MNCWKAIERPGSFGKKRDEKYAGWDRQYGKGNWRLVHFFGEAELDFLGVCAVYEDAYFQFLEKNPRVLDQLICEASDVWDDAESNVQSGLDYLKQETIRTHIQDIAIRRSIARMGLSFKGEHLIRVRDALGSHPLSLALSPGRVPFHQPLMIMIPELKGWWMSGSIESFYQSNKLLQIKMYNLFVPC